jgi:hypothetical protein
MSTSSVSVESAVAVMLAQRGARGLTFVADKLQFADQEVAKPFVDQGRNVSDGKFLAIQASTGRLMHHKIEGTKRGAFFTNVGAE